MKCAKHAIQLAVFWGKSMSSHEKNILVLDTRKSNFEALACHSGTKFACLYSADLGRYF
jgi:hypothetical protein